jgi:hypothetical protein
LCERKGTSAVAAGCIGGLDVRIILAVFSGLRSVVLAGRVVVPTGRRADFAAFCAEARTSFPGFLAARRAVLVDRRAAFVECLLIVSI